MKIKPGFELREVCGEHIIVNYGLENIDFSKIISLNETATSLWRAMDGRDSFTVDDMLETLKGEYEVVDADAVRTDCENIARQWVEVGLAE